MLPPPTSVVLPPPPPPPLVFPLVIFLIVLLILVYNLKRSPTPSVRLRLPPGSMGWPYIGETLKLYTENPNSFFSNRERRYGEIFKTHILGCPCVMISSPKLAKIVLVTKSHMFKPTYPPSKEKMIGPEAVFFHQGPYHSHLKKLIQTSFLPFAIKGSVSHIEDVVVRLLRTWEHNDTINTLHEMKKYAFEVAIVSVFGNKLESEIEGIRNMYQCLEKGYNSMPLDLPGTPFNKAMKARKALNQKLRRVIDKRKEINGGEGLLGALLSNEEDGKMNMKLSESQIADNIIGVIFAAHDTTASVLTWLLKYLHADPDLLHAVRKEQEEIRCKSLEANRRITWDDTRRMPLSTRVIQETLRAASILSFTYREAVEDVEMEGYLIPKGWKVLPLFRSIHYSSQFFPQPHKFDPSRFEGDLIVSNQIFEVLNHVGLTGGHMYGNFFYDDFRSLADSSRTLRTFESTLYQHVKKYDNLIVLGKVAPRPNTYMPFGNGIHSCPGSELAKLEMLVLLHHLTTTFRWEVIGEDGVQYGPFPVPRDGLPIKVYPANNKY